MRFAAHEAAPANGTLRALRFEQMALQSCTRGMRGSLF
jgi:hypothetical protein